MTADYDPDTGYDIADERRERAAEDAAEAEYAERSKPVYTYRELYNALCEYSHTSNQKELCFWLGHVIATCYERGWPEFWVSFDDRTGILQVHYVKPHFDCVRHVVVLRGDDGCPRYRIEGGLP